MLDVAMLPSFASSQSAPAPALTLLRCTHTVACGPRILQAKEVHETDGISCEVMDLRTLLPWDADGVEASVRKTGR